MWLEKCRSSRCSHQEEWKHSIAHPTSFNRAISKIEPVEETLAQLTAHSITKIKKLTTKTCLESWAQHLDLPAP